MPAALIIMSAPCFIIKVLLLVVDTLAQNIERLWLREACLVNVSATRRSLICGPKYDRAGKNEIRPMLVAQGGFTVF